MSAEVEEGELGADVAALWRMMAQNIYKGGDLPALATREALQNAVDSIRKAYRQGTLQKGAGRFEVESHGNTLVLRDNGVGMTRDILKRVFFRLAATGKSGDTEASGGFGAAKAVILGAAQSGRWEVHTLDTVAKSGEGIGYRMEPTRFHQGVEITLHDIDTGSTWNWTAEKYEELQERLRNILAFSNVSDVTLTFNGRTVEPIFPGRRGSPLPTYEQRDWGPDTEVKIKTHQRRVGSGSGAAYVRLNGLYQFSVRPEGEIPFDTTFDVTTKLRPQSGVPAYPFNAARDAFNDRSVARRTFYNVWQEIVREAVSSNRPREYDTLVGDSSDPREREGAELVASEMAAILDTPEIRDAFEGLLGAAEEMYAAEVQRSHQEDRENAPSEAPATYAKQDPYAGFRDAIVTTISVDPTTPEGRAALANAVLEVVPVEGLTPEAVAAIRALEGGAVPTEAAIGAVLQGLADAPAVVAADPNRIDESPIAVAAAASKVAEAIAKLAKHKPRPPSPFGSAAMVKISRLHFDRSAARKFVKEAGKYLPLLAVWDLTLRVIGREAKIRITFRPGFVLDDTVRGVCVSEGQVGTGIKNFVLLHPLMGPLALYFARGGAAKVTPQQIASYLHSVACHEMAHLPVIGRGGKPHGHDEAWAVQREDLGVATGHLLPGIETAVRSAMYPKMRDTQRKAATPQVRKLEAELRTARSKLAAFARGGPLPVLAEKLQRLAQYEDFRQFLRSAGDLGGHSGTQVLALVERHPQALVDVMLGSIVAPRMETFSLAPPTQLAQRQWDRQKAFNREGIAAAKAAATGNLRVQACVARCLTTSARKRYTPKPAQPATPQLRLEGFGVAAAATQLAVQEATAITLDASACIAGCFSDELKRSPDELNRG